MGTNQARALAKYHKFTKIELYEILVKALNSESDNYWKKPNTLNRIFDNGYYFNRCREWLSYKKGENDNEHPPEIITVRILQGFGKYSKVQIPKKIKVHTDIMGSEKPTLKNK